MRFVSTRGKSPSLSVSEALQVGLAPDGGLYVPEHFPSFDPDSFSGNESFPDLAQQVLTPFFSNDALASSLNEICGKAFDFPIFLRDLRDGTSVLELFHGPTAAFKDFGARFLSECLTKFSSAERTILVATSGDTGGAVAAAFFRKPNTRVVILFPKSGVSERQLKQLTCWGENVQAFAVRGSFDDCQRLVKQALSNVDLKARHALSSANSINIGRLLPQVAYHAAASIWYRLRHHASPGLIIPSGNVGNAVAALWAKRMGFPIREVVLATNENRTLADYFESGNWEPRKSVSTLANAMDVGNPSNMERFFDLYSGQTSGACAVSISDERIRQEIREGKPRWGEVWCPHTATAVSARSMQRSPHWIIVATAHPAKFDTIVEPLIGHPVEIPPTLSALLSRPSAYREISPEFTELCNVLS